jgi:hypothetical protein
VPWGWGAVVVVVVVGEGDVVPVVVVVDVGWVVGVVVDVGWVVVVCCGRDGRPEVARGAEVEDSPVRGDKAVASPGPACFHPHYRPTEGQVACRTQERSATE